MPDFVALVSGGKDSCHSILHCLALGYNLVAVANLKPAERGEADSFMYQTVGCEAVHLIAEALGVPFFQETIQGSAVCQQSTYETSPDDEVEDLTRLLRKVVDAHPSVTAVSVGAILSDYQRVRVENICARLHLKSLAFLWQRDQEELLAEMIACNLDARIVKVAAMGLTTKHLGKSLAQLQAVLVKLNRQFGVHVCGEGGEYETFVLDSPVFRKKIVIDEQDVVLHSDDAFAPVAYNRILSAHVEDKEDYENELASALEVIRQSRPDYHTPQDLADNPPPPIPDGRNFHVQPFVSVTTVPGVGKSLAICGIQAKEGFDSISATVAEMFVRIKEALKTHSMSLSDVRMMYLLLSDLSQFQAVNDEYRKVFDVNPPTRVCIQSAGTSLFQMECLAFAPVGELRVKHMHVQSISHWAPANIGPYSQAVQMGNWLILAGQIGLYPPEMTLEPSVESQVVCCKQNITHVLEAHQRTLSHALVIVCFLTNLDLLSTARKVIHDENVIQVYVEVPRLPRDAKVEYHVVASTDGAEKTTDSGESTPECCTLSWKTVSSISCTVATVSLYGEINTLEAATNLVQRLKIFTTTASLIYAQCFETISASKFPWEDFQTSCEHENLCIPLSRIAVLGAQNDAQLTLVLWLQHPPCDDD